ncbi:Glutathione S-transferase kappa 1 [Dissophora ornata]|nr:Glutathione S-transferase kappa 1 [Dissophora ornata]
MTSRASIIVYYDVVSPYSYYGIKLLNRYRPQWKDVDVEFRPSFLAGILEGAKNQAPGVVAAKGAYMYTDLNKISVATGIPFQFPSRFPLLTITPMRLLIVVQKHAADKYEKCIEKDEYWCNDKEITDADVLVDALAPILGAAKVKEFLQMTSQKEIKQELISNTNQAIEAGAFGAPTFIVKKAGPEEEDHIFFGSDRFELIASFLDVPYPGLAPNPAAKL